MASIGKTQVAMTVAPVVSAAILGAGFQLIFYPQVVVGAAFLGLGILMKLLSAWVGIVIIVMLLVSAGAIAIVLHTRLAKGLPHAAAAVLKRLGPNLVQRIRRIPPWMFVVAAFGLPAIGQLIASLNVVRTLVSVGVESSPVAIGGFSAFSLILTLLVQVFGLFSSAWLQPGKVNFLLQTFWVIKAILSGSFTKTTDNRPLIPLLSTILVGWGSVILSSLPDRAVLDASQAAMRAAMVSGAAAASVTAGVALKRAKESQQPLAIPDEADENYKLVKAIEEMPDSDDDEPELSEEDQKFKDEFMAALGWITKALEQVMARLKERMDPNLSKIFDQINQRLYEAETGVHEIADALDEKNTADDVVVEDVEPEGLVIDKPPGSVSGEEEPPLALTMLLHINPPIGVAIFIAFIRAVPTLIVFVLAEILAVFSLIRGTGRKNGIFFPMVLLPFALAEIFALVKQVGFAKGFKSIYRLSLDAETDGLSILLWRSPKLLAAWNQFKQADQRLGTIGGNLMSVLMYPKQLLFPSEEAIAQAPDLDPSVIAKLLTSIVIDIIGVTTLAIPGLGEFLDIMWAPVSGMIINQVYGSPGFAFMGFAEEILPFTDILPTATIAWLWLYGVFLPIWGIRMFRQAQKEGRLNPEALRQMRIAQAKIVD